MVSGHAKAVIDSGADGGNGVAGVNGKHSKGHVGYGGGLGPLSFRFTMLLEKI